MDIDINCTHQYKWIVTWVSCDFLLVATLRQFIARLIFAANFSCVTQYSNGPYGQTLISQKENRFFNFEMSAKLCAKLVNPSLAVYHRIRLEFISSRSFFICSIFQLLAQLHLALECLSSFKLKPSEFIEFALTTDCTVCHSGHHFKHTVSVKLWRNPNGVKMPLKKRTRRNLTRASCTKPLIAPPFALWCFKSLQRRSLGNFCRFIVCRLFLQSLLWLRRFWLRCSNMNLSLSISSMAFSTHRNLCAFDDDVEWATMHRNVSADWRANITVDVWPEWNEDDGGDGTYQSQHD